MDPTPALALARICEILPDPASHDAIPSENAWCWGLDPPECQSERGSGARRVLLRWSHRAPIHCSDASRARRRCGHEQTLGLGKQEYEGTAGAATWIQKATRPQSGCDRTFGLCQLGPRAHRADRQLWVSCWRVQSCAPQRPRAAVRAARPSAAARPRAPQTSRSRRRRCRPCPGDAPGAIGFSDDLGELEAAVGPVIRGQVARCRSSSPHHRLDGTCPASSIEQSYCDAAECFGTQRVALGRFQSRQRRRGHTCARREIQ
jgi:hypothetical protein